MIDFFFFLLLLGVEFFKIDFGGRDAEADVLRPAPGGSGVSIFRWRMFLAVRSLQLLEI